MATPIFKRDEIILLLGAGASVEADIPDSSEMVQKIEGLVSDDAKLNWSVFRDLYRYVRSSIFYADGLDGIFDDKVPFNIERLVNVLDELSRKERHTLYPFVGAWNSKLRDVAGDKFEEIGKFRSAIISILRNDWVALPEKEKAAYYQGLLRDLKANEPRQKNLSEAITSLGYKSRAKREDRTVTADEFTSAVIAEAVLAVWRERPYQAKFSGRKHFGMLMMGEIRAGELDLPEVTPALRT